VASANKYAAVKGSAGTYKWFPGELTAPPSGGGEVMGFHNILHPEGIQYGSSGGPGFNTIFTELDSGATERVARWPKSKRTFNAVHNIKSRDALSDILTFFEARKGALNGFRYHDYSDDSTASDHRSAPGKTDVELADAGDGSKTSFQLIKRYTSGDQTVIRVIKLPVAGTCLCTVGGVDKFEGTDFEINDTTGEITFNVAPSLGDVITVGFRFHVPVHYGPEADKALKLAVDSFGSGSLPEVELVELTDDVLLPEEFDYGWGTNIGDQAIALTWSPNMGRAIRVNPTAAITLYLPDPSVLTLGGPWATIWNDSGTYNVSLQVVNAPSSFDVIAPGETGTMYIFSKNDASTWKKH
jgi:uncharacterized protein (TIGR02217 family)